MNIILVLIDSLNRSGLSCYDPDKGDTPYLDTFAQSSLLFENAFVGSLPCMPARRDIFTGRKELLWRPWGPIEPGDPRLPRLLQQQGYSTGIVTDHYHYWEEHGNGYIQSFQSSELIRGNEVDAWRPVKPDKEVPRWVRAMERWRPEWARQYFANVEEFRDEEDFFTAKVFTAGMKWLSQFARDCKPFFLQVECFDPHEPFHVPEPYRSMAREHGDDVYTIWPPYQNSHLAAEFMASTTEEELSHIRDRYRAKVRMVDRWFGRFMASVERLGLAGETIVIVTTDHGHELGDRGAFGKSDPHYDYHANIPLLIRHPEGPVGERTPALVSAVDLFATVLDAAGSPYPEHDARGHSSSFLPVVHEPSRPHRSATLYGTYGQGLAATDGTWTLLKAPAQEGPLYSYSSMIFSSMMVSQINPPDDSGHFIPGCALPQWKTPVRDRGHACMNATPRGLVGQKVGDLLFHRTKDPAQLNNRWADAVEERNRMLALMRSLMAAEGAPPEQYERLGLKA